MDTNTNIIKIIIPVDEMCDSAFNNIGLLGTSLYNYQKEHHKSINIEQIIFCCPKKVIKKNINAFKDYNTISFRHNSDETSKYIDKLFEDAIYIPREEIETIKIIDQLKKDVCKYVFFCYFFPYYFYKLFYALESPDIWEFTPDDSIVVLDEPYLFVGIVKNGQDRMIAPYRQQIKNVFKEFDADSKMDQFIDEYLMSFYKYFTESESLTRIVALFEKPASMVPLIKEEPLYLYRFFEESISSPNKAFYDFAMSPLVDLTAKIFFHTQIAKDDNSKHKMTLDKLKKELKKEIKSNPEFRLETNQLSNYNTIGANSLFQRLYSGEIKYIYQLLSDEKVKLFSKILNQESGSIFLLISDEPKLAEFILSDFTEMGYEKIHATTPFKNDLESRQKIIISNFYSADYPTRYLILKKLLNLPLKSKAILVVTSEQENMMNMIDGARWYKCRIKKFSEMGSKKMDLITVTVLAHYTNWDAYSNYNFTLTVSDPYYIEYFSDIDSFADIINILTEIDLIYHWDGYEQNMFWYYFVKAKRKYQLLKQNELKKKSIEAKSLQFDPNHYEWVVYWNYEKPLRLRASQGLHFLIHLYLNYGSEFSPLELLDTYPGSYEKDASSALRKIRKDVDGTLGRIHDKEIKYKLGHELHRFLKKCYSTNHKKTNLTITSTVNPEVIKVEIFGLTDYYEYLEKKDCKL